MAELNLDYYSGEDLYSDGDVEDEILKYVREGKTAEDINHASFPVMYHLAKMRENILNWYPFAKDSSVLEIGSGCGAITGLLCERAGRVVSVELSKRRAGINFERHKDWDNLKIYAGNQNDIDFDTGFDYIILNGVFEYAKSFTSGDTPYETFLNNIRGFLAPGGKILIAIENRLGLKYFAGAPEDHTDGYFDGINEYAGNNSVRTFSKYEWEILMKRCGLDYYRFYYPYPDYKFPVEIFTDESLKNQRYGRPVWNFTDDRFSLFSEEKAAASLQREGVMAQFADSFLIEMSDSPFSDDRKVIYAKLDTDRLKEFSIATVIGQQRNDGTPETVVRKCPMDIKAWPHIRRMAAGMSCDYGAWHPLLGRLDDEGIVYPFLTRKSLAERAAIAVAEKKADEVRGLFRRVYELCKSQGIKKYRGAEISGPQSAGFCEVFGPEPITEDMECVSPANVDLILDNIYETDEQDSYQVADCEWIFDFPVPVLFILWRSVNEFYSTQSAAASVCPEDVLLGEFGITDEMAGIFRKWGIYFAEHYVGADAMRRRSIPELPLSLAKCRERYMKIDSISCSLYIDTGNGFSEEQRLTAICRLAEGRFFMTFDLKDFDDVRSLRFDPLEGRPCLCMIDAEQTSVKMLPLNAAQKTECGDLFLTSDPNYQVKISKGASTVKISGKITLLTEREALDLADSLLRKSSIRKIRQMPQMVNIRWKK